MARSYRVGHRGLSWSKDGRRYRAEVGDVTSDLPSASIDSLLARGLIAAETEPERESGQPAEIEEDEIPTGPLPALESEV